MSSIKEILYLALAEPVGLLLQVGDFHRDRAKLYSTRAQIGDPSLSGLQFRAVNFEDGNLAIVNQRVQLPAAGATS